MRRPKIGRLRWLGACNPSVATGRMEVTVKRSITMVGLVLIAGACALPSDSEEDGDAKTAKVRSAANERGCYPTELASEHALCVCRDFDMVGRLVTERVGDHPASVGVEGESVVVASVDVDGAWHGQHAIDAVASMRVAGELRTASAFSWVGAQHIGGDLSVGGDADGVGDIEVGGAVRVAGDVSTVGELRASSQGAYEASPAPCNCQGDDFFDVEMAVWDARAHNDNAMVSTHAGMRELSLPSGRYYLEGFDNVGDVHIRAEGDVALFIEGDVALVGHAQFSVAPGAHLDVYVAGDVATVGNVDLGDPDDPSAFRLFVGGEGSVLVNVGAQRYHGYLYAPRASVHWVGDTEIHGGLVAGALTGVGDVWIAYPGGASIGGETCTDEPIRDTPPSEPGSDVPLLY